MYKLPDSKIEQLCTSGKVVFQGLLIVEYGYLYAKALCWLPLEEDSNDLNSILVRPDRELWGNRLHFSVGMLDHCASARLVTHQKHFPLSVESIKPAEDWVDQTLTQGMRVIKQAILDYRHVRDRIRKFDPMVLDIASV